MPSQLQFCGLILAAGASTRMGRDKALLPWPADSKTETLLSAAIGALRPFTDAVIVVAGRNAASLEPVVARCGAVLVCNSEPERGQFSSLHTGARAVLDHGFDAAMMTPVDCVPLSGASLQQLRAAFAEALDRGAWAVAPESNGRRGHPLLAARPLLEAYLAVPVSSNAREVKRAHLEKFESLAVPDPLLTVDVNTPEQYQGLAQSWHEQS